MKDNFYIVDEMGLVNFLTLNPSEKMIPFNLWFELNSLKIVDVHENNQHIRARQYKGSFITPLLTDQNKNFSHLKSCLAQMSLYQPYYPESFYNIWEFMDSKFIFINSNINSILCIGDENKMGMIEATMLYLEKNQIIYESNVYHCWLANNETYDIDSGTYQFQLPKIDYLSQTYKSIFLDNSEKLIKYELISIDVISYHKTIFDWTNEEKNLQATIFYLLMATSHLTNNGSILIKMNMLCRSNWNIIFQIASESFRECSFYRSSLCHPYNSEIYLFMTKFKRNSMKDSLNKIEYSCLKNLHRLETYKYGYVNTINVNINLINKYQSEINSWINKLSSNEELPMTDMPLEWHIKYDLYQVGHLWNQKYLSNQYDLYKPIKYSLLTSSQDFKIRPTIPYEIYCEAVYKKIIQKKSDLNICKRVLDTKPSEIFLDNPKDSSKFSHNMITWDHLMRCFDYHQSIKKELKFLGAEMVTNAWIKMYEMLKDINFVGDNITTFHLCEAPGAFISALNHYLTTRMDINWAWYAQSLNPSDNSLALQDHYGFIKKYPHKWLFGKDNTGDITHSCVIKSYASDSRLKKIDFMTADAGLKCHPRDLNEQEAYMAKINMGQIICILACLSIGKSAIFKTFLPLTEPLNLSMIYLLTHLFENVDMIKPMSSRSYNSEIYIILKGYNGISKAVLESLYMLLDDPKVTSKTLLFNDIDKKVFDSYSKAVKSLIGRQIQSLYENYYYYYNCDKINEINYQKYYDAWFKMNPVAELRKKLL